MKLFTIIHPSRSRAIKSYNCVCNWHRHYSGRPENLELIVSLDEDDPQLTMYLERYLSTDVIVNKNKSSIEAINKAAEKSTGRILIVASDDSDLPPSWNKDIMNAVEGKSDFLLRVSDGIQKRICTMPIMDRAYYNRFGYIYNPVYSHSWADAELTEVAYELGRIIVRNDIEFKHLHPEITKEEKDYVYLKNDATHDPGRVIFRERQRLNFGL
jgi:glycosyltransferase involved in cell wall biosynthesis